MNRLVAALGTPEERAQCLRHCHLTQPRAGQVAPWPDWLAPEVVLAYQTMGIDQPWRHQVSAMEAIHAGRHTVLATGTGSGKSLALWAPVLSDLSDAGPLGSVSTLRERPAALYLAPTKALAADQLTALSLVLRAGGLDEVPIGTCDGDASFEARDFAAAQAAVVLTNPDYLHFALLPGHHRWSRLLRALRYVFVDELHAYRGLSGAHVAMVLRRLRRLARHYGSDPVFLLASATVAEPAESAARLVGLDVGAVAAVTEDWAAAGARTQVVYQPMVQGQDGTWQPGSASQAAARLAADLAEVGARTVVFVRSRFAAEAVAATTRRLVSGSASRRIATYRGGYLAHERRALETQLRDGTLRVVVATSALELGIDVAGLDAVITVGWPGTRVALAQQAGRTGRAGADGLSVWVAGSDPLDSYLVDHPAALFEAPLEASVFDPANPYVLAPHLCAAAGELPLTGLDQDLFGSGMDQVLEQLATQGVLRRRASGWHWVLPDAPSNLTDLRGAGGAPVELVESATGRVLGTVDQARAPATVHPGAVYLHQGEAFLVESLDLDVGLAALKAATVPYTTLAISQRQLRVIETLDHQADPAAAWHYGQVEVVSQVVGYQRIGSNGQGKLGSIPLELPPQHLRTTAAWCVPTPSALEPIPTELLPGALHAAEHAAIGLLPLLAACDRWDLGGWSTPDHPQTSGPTFFIYDGVPGGAGLAQRGFERRAELLEATHSRLITCSCQDGCPSCIQSPKCGNANQILSKAGAIDLLTALLG